MVHILPLSYCPDSTFLFEAIRHQPYAVFLDSGRPHSAEGRFDIITANPQSLVLSRAGITEVRDLNSGQSRQVHSSPFSILDEVMAETGYDSDVESATTDWPFSGGALGYFSYDLGRYLETLPALAERDIELPDMQVGIYDWAILVDHQQQQSRVLYRNDKDADRMQALAKQLQQRLAEHSSATEKHAPDAEPGDFRLKAPFQSNLSDQDYRQLFRRTLDYIHAGDCYQINLAQRLSAPFEGDCWQAYKSLRPLAPTPFSAYLETPDGAVLSLSPERFLQVHADRVETKPIKGTRPRGRNPADDQQLRQALQESSKDRAENLMIVDLLRNDLGKTCLPGSIEVPELFKIESYANVHHLVSTVTGRLPGPDARLKLLEGCFPGGSITGAPKVRAMEIIEELEPHRRSVYCGSVGYISFNGRMDTSISIRTLVAADGWLHCWAGGGIVADSQCDEEYQETFDKINNLIGPLEQQFLLKS